MPSSVNNGFLDLYVPRRAGETKLLYRNNGNANKWLTVRLVGTRSNRSAIGVKVRVRALMADGKFMTQTREIPGGNRAQDDLRAHFGLGGARNVMLTIEWPSGVVEELRSITANQFLTIVEPGLRGAFGSDGLFRLTMTGNTNRTYDLKVSTDLQNWTTLTNCAGLGPNGTVEVCDPAAGGTQRFYWLK